MVSCNIWRSGTGVSLFRFTRSQSFVLTLAYISLTIPLQTLKATKLPSPDAEKDLPSNGPKLTRTTSRQSVQRKTARYIRTTKRIFLDPFRVCSFSFGGKQGPHTFFWEQSCLYHSKIVLLLGGTSNFLSRFLDSCPKKSHADSEVRVGSLYLLNISLQTVFSKPPYNFSTTLVGLTYIPNSIGYVLSSLFGGKWTDKIMAREAKRAGRYDEKGKLMYIPEDRMRENAWIAAFLYPAALIWYGWTAEKGVFWLVPLIANFFFGIGSMLIFAMATTMLTEFMPKKASNGVAVNNFVRNIFSCVGAVVAQPLINAIGNGWLFTGVGCIAMASSVVVWAMRRFGPRWRQAMDRELDKEG